MEAPTAIEETNVIRFDSFEKEEDDKYELALDYFSRDNPYKKVIIGASVGVIGSYSTAIIALSFSQAFISGGILYYDTACLICGFGSLFSIIGAIIAIPAIIGGIGYGIYKMKKTSDLKEYMNKLSDTLDSTMKEEREIYGLLIKECKSYFQIQLNSSFSSEVKKKIKENTKKVIERINKINITDEIKKKEDLENLRNEINDMSKINILIIGATGTGKSTLINEFLELKKNKAQEGNSANPMKIDNWPKRYPILDDDGIKFPIYIFDTEGIEKTVGGNNDINTHLEKVMSFITSSETKLDNKINAIWYCISGNKLDGDEDYINSILNLYTSKIKIPIIFVYTKAYASKENEIECIKEGLENFEYFKNKENELNFIEVIARDNISKKTQKILDEKKGLNELFDKTISLSDKTILSPIYQQISNYYNKKAKEEIKSLSNKLQEQYQKIVIGHSKFKYFLDYLYDIYECVYGNIFKNITNIKKEITEILKEIYKIMYDIRYKELKNIVYYYDKNYLMNKLENEIKIKYDEKKTKKKTYLEFKQDIDDYLITQINSSIEIYGQYFLYDMFRDVILEGIIHDLEKRLNKEKLEMTNELKNQIMEKIQQFKKKFETQK